MCRGLAYGYWVGGRLRCFMPLSKAKYAAAYVYGNFLVRLRLVPPPRTFRGLAVHTAVAGCLVLTNAFGMSRCRKTCSTLAASTAGVNALRQFA